MLLQKNKYLIIETIFIFIASAIAAVLLWQSNLAYNSKIILYVPLLLFQGLWFYRFYIVGHEAAHKKLFKDNLPQNDFWGSVILLPLMTPINIYRKIHYFHHGFNRKDEHTSALDTFIIKGKYKKLKKIRAFVLWYLGVFCGGFFVHSLVSVILFLFMPPSIAIKISPAFKGWSWADQSKAILLFLIGVLLHVTIYFIFGKQVYLLALGYPFLAFAWVLSLLVYIFHYHTTIGHNVRYNVRSVHHVPFFSWVLLNFNNHATHHQYPNIPWHELPAKQQVLPQEFAKKNQNTYNFFRAIINQINGPEIVYE